MNQSPETILCQQCNKNARANSQSMLCKDCSTANGILPITELPTVNVERPIDLTDNGIAKIRQLEFAPPSIRYDGKQLDEIAWAMTPALAPEKVLAIRQKIITDTRALISGNESPDLQAMEIAAEYFAGLSNVFKQLVEKQKTKIKLQAKPELKRLEAERKAQEKVTKIQKSIPRDTLSQHTANILFDGIATITTPPGKEHQSLLKNFFETANLQFQMDDTIDGEWIAKWLSKSKYQPLKQYFKILAVKETV